VNIYELVSNDTLHQIDIGICKHLLGWLEEMIKGLYSETKSKAVYELVNNRFIEMPRYPGIKHFNNGIFGLKNVSAGEMRSIFKVNVV
jgi:hypothetical protein